MRFKKLFDVSSKEETNTNRQRHHKKILPSLLAVFFITFFCAGLCVPHAPVFAAPQKGYEALQVTMTGGGTLKMKPRETKQVTVQFQNKGPKTWKNTGEAFVSVYTHGPKYRISDFENSWFHSDQPALLQESSVAAGETGTITFPMTAPSKTGTYKETFALAAEDVAWIPGGTFTLTIEVSACTSSCASAPSSSTSIGVSSPLSNGLSATLQTRTPSSVKVKPGEIVDYKIKVRNSGTLSWNVREVRTLDMRTASVATLASMETRHKSWLATNCVAMKASDPVDPGESDTFRFKFTAPKKEGSYTVRYRLAVDDTLLSDFYIDIPVEVTSGADRAQESEVIVEEEQIINKIEEPVIRIGVLIVDDETQQQVIVSCDRPWNLTDGSGAVLEEMETGKRVTAFYKKGHYTYNTGEGAVETSSYLRFVPKEKDAVCTIENFDRRVTRGTAHPDNTFRDVLELRYNDAHNRTWVINELPVEEYLYGLAETSNDSHAEFQKTLVTIARTYALYHWERATKHADEFFHMTAYSGDQVYKGYGYEQRVPRVVQAVEDTRGITVTYEGRTAITPYFSRSNGQTYDWSEVWGGDVPWVKGVACPCDKGKTQWGHGVGLSASEALCQAKNGKSWEDILHYFYWGVELTKRWE
jgi:peptidoglycan hydrolase-like amidase